MVVTKMYTLIARDIARRDIKSDVFINQYDRHRALSRYFFWQKVLEALQKLERN